MCGVCVYSMTDVDSVRTGSFLFAAMGVGLVGLCGCVCLLWEGMGVGVWDCVSCG